MSLPGSSENPLEYPLNDDIVQPFQIDASHLRGRLVRVGPVLDEILSKHAYPEPVARLLGETITLAITLAGALKYEGIFTLQTKGDGPISLMVADVTSTGDVRGYAQFDAERLAAAPTSTAPPRFPPCSATAISPSPSIRASIPSATRASSNCPARPCRTASSIISASPNSSTPASRSRSPSPMSAGAAAP